MAIIKRALAHGKHSYWISFQWQGKRVWERSESNDRRKAESLERQRKAEVAAGTYEPKSMRAATTFGQYAKSWAKKRKNRNADNDRAALKIHVFPREWLTALALVDVRKRHMHRLIEELRASKSVKTGKLLSEKSVSNVYNVVRTIFTDAHEDELIEASPAHVKQGTFTFVREEGRLPYSAGEIVALIADDRIALPNRVWNALAFFTGMRLGEVCGRRWRDWDSASRPLGALTIASQYNDRPLKTAKARGHRARRVPVHPTLARILDAWWLEGFELVHCRKPTQDDFIVPGEREFARARGAIYAAWVRDCRKLGIPNRTVHATRHTFISLARRGSDRKDLVEKLTHNARGSILDQYTHTEWDPLCAVVLSLGRVQAFEGVVDCRVDSPLFLPSPVVTPPGVEPGKQSDSLGNSAGSEAIETDSEPPSSPDSGAKAAERDASKRPCLDPLCDGGGEVRFRAEGSVHVYACPTCSGAEVGA